MRTRPIPPVDTAVVPLRPLQDRGIFDWASTSPSLLPLVKQGKRQLRWKLYALILVTDVLCIYLSFAFGTLARFGDLDEGTWLRMALAATPLFLGIAGHNRAYSDETLKSPGTSAGRAVSSLITAFALLFVISYFLKAEQDVSRLSVALGGVTAVVAIAGSRKLIGDWINKTYCGQLTATIIIADETMVSAPADAVILDPLTAGLKPECRNPEMLQRLIRLVEGADRVVVACRREACSSWAMLLKGANIRAEILADEVQSVGAVSVARLGTRTTLVVSAGPLTLQQRAIKRAFDLALTVAILIVVWPVLLAIAIAIKLDTPGPVLFKQPRVGFGNKLFDVYKFRSMATESSDRLGSESTSRGDSRVTRVGNFIRRTSLDELPQLLNVLNGSMSLVGPRPHALGSQAGPLFFWDVDDRYPHRHLLKPGITGLAQIRGQRGTTHQVDDLARRLQSDLEYMAGWSIWRDMLIILKTLRVMAHQNAY